MSDWLQLFEIARFGRPLVLFLSLLAVGWVLARLLPRRMATTAVPVARRVMVVAPALALAAFFTISAWYAIDRRYYDFAEPTMPAVAWMSRSASRSYPPPDAPERYAHIYGPMAFIPYAVAIQVLGQDLRTVKWVSTSAALLSLLVLFLLLRSTNNLTTRSPVHGALRPVAAGVSKHGLLAASGFSRTVLRDPWPVGGGERIVRWRLDHPRCERGCSLEPEISAARYTACRCSWCSLSALVLDA